MNEKYDAVVCGTGLVECIISGLLSQEGIFIFIQAKKSFISIEILSMVERALLSILPTSGKYSSKNKNLQKSLDTIEIGISISFLNTLCPEVNLLKFSWKQEYLDIWNGNVILKIYLLAIDGTYVLQNKEAGFFSKGGLKIAKVPVTPKEALSSDLMGMMEKRRCQKFMEAMQNFEENNPKTHEKI